MTDHRPGPWRVVRMACQTENHTYNSEVVAADSNEVASILRERDAILIAAAPDLLQALEHCLTVLEIVGKGPEAQAKAREAIKKARGAQ